MAKLKQCKTCGNEIAKSAKICPHCGAKNKKSVGCIPATIIILFFIVFISSLTMPKDYAVDSAPEPQLKAGELWQYEQGFIYTACKEQVRKQLKSPTTAKFESITKGRFGKESTSIAELYTIQYLGSVSSQNSFGAMITTNYACEASILESDEDANIKGVSVKFY